MGHAFALNVYKAARLELTLEKGIQWWRIEFDGSRFVYVFEPLSAGTHTLSLESRTYGVISDAPVKWKFDTDVEIISKEEKDPWPVPHPAPPPLLAGLDDTAWEKVVWGQGGGRFLPSAGAKARPSSRRPTARKSKRAPRKAKPKKR